jgi:hypothetical protein
MSDAARVPIFPGPIFNPSKREGLRMAFVEDKQFRYPAEDECLVRRLGSAVITAWPHLPREVQEKIFDEAKLAWDREHFVSKLSGKLDGIIRRRHA